MTGTGTLSKKDMVMSMILIAVLFFVFGFVTWVNAILIPYFKIACELSNFQSYLVAFAFYISYLLMAVPSSRLLKWKGFKKGMMIGFWIMSAGAFTFILAALFRQYEIFLLGLFGIGTGLTILQTAANPYVTILGPREAAARRISIVGICNKGAGILAPLLFAAIILKAGDNVLFKQIPLLPQAQREQVLNELIRRVIVPYACVGAVLFLLGLMVRFSSLPEIDTEHESSELEAANSRRKNIFSFPHLILGVLAIFLHVGTQVIAVDTVIAYAGSMNISLHEAKAFPSYTLMATIAGYIAGILLIPKWISQTTALRICTVLGFVLSAFVVASRGEVNWLGHRTGISLCFLIALGLANSLIWAGIWPLALNGLGRFTKIGASLLIMGLCGNALLPLAYGYLADKWGLQSAYRILLPCYLYLVFYSVYGYRVSRWGWQKPKANPGTAIN